MTAGPNLSGPRGFNATTNPDQFTNNPQLRYTKNTSLELLIYENQSNSTGNTVYSDPVVVNSVEGFTVYVNGSGTISVQGAISPESNTWTELGSITDTGIYSNSQPIGFIRIGLADGVSNTTVWVQRKYSTY